LFWAPAAVQAAKSFTACVSLPDGQFRGMKPSDVQQKSPLLLMPPDMYPLPLIHEKHDEALDEHSLWQPP
jgi:hypothetical protein